MGKEVDKNQPKAKAVWEEKQMKVADYKLIQHYHEKYGWPISKMCRILDIGRASYYKWLNRSKTQREIENEKLLIEIKAIADENNRLFGYRKMTYILQRKLETSVNHKRVYRLMCIYNLESVYRRKRHSTWRNSTPDQTAENVMNRDFNASAPNMKWGTDITEIAWPGIPQKAYISTIVDHYDRYPVAVVVSRKNDIDLVNRTIDKALAAFPDAHPLFHSDRGFQYTRKPFQNKLLENGITPSMSRVNRCIDNGMVEGFQGQIKDILRILHPDISTWEELVDGIYHTYDYYTKEYPQERFHGKTSGEVRAEALAVSQPIEYPIKINVKIEKFWNMVQSKKAAKEEPLQP